MPDVPIPPVSPLYCGQTAEAIALLEKVIVEGLKHGFFECSIACEIAGGNKRQLTIRAGKSFRFTIPEGELPR